MKKAYEEVAIDYSLKNDVFFIGDSAAVNTAAFGNNGIVVVSVDTRIIE